MGRERGNNDSILAFTTAGIVGPVGAGRITTTGEPVLETPSTFLRTILINEFLARIRCTAAAGGANVLLQDVELIALVTSNIAGIGPFELELPLEPISLPRAIAVTGAQVGWWTLQRAVHLSIGDNLSGAGLAGRLTTVALRVAASLVQGNGETFALDYQAHYELTD